MTCQCCGAPPPVIGYGGTINGKHADQWNVGNFVDELFIGGVEVFALTGVVSVESVDDFPAAVAGVTTLEVGIMYIVNGFVAMGTTRIEWSDSSIVMGRNNVHDGLIYTGSGTFLTGTDSYNTRGLTYIATDSSSTLLDISGVNTEVIIFRETNSIGFGTIGTLDEIQIFASILSLWSGFGKGFLFTGTGNESCFFQSGTLVAGANTGTLMDLGTSVFRTIIIDTGRIETFAAGQIGINGAADSANVSDVGSIHGAVFAGPGDHTNGILNTDLRWRFLDNSGNQGTEDSVNRGAMTMQNNATATVVSTGWPQKTLGTRVAGNLSRFTFNADGTLTYIGLPDIRVEGIINCSPSVVAGANQTLVLYPALNGVIMTSFATTVVMKTGDVKSVTLPFETNMSTDDTLDLWVDNMTGIISVVIVSSKFTAIGF